MAKESRDSLDSRRIGRAPGKPGVQIGSGGLKSADRLQGGAGPASWAECAEVWAALLGWAEPEGVGPRKGVLGREHWRAGPNLRAKRVARSGLYLRRGGTSRIFSAGLSRASWAESARLDLQKPKRWAEPVRRRTSEKTKIGGEEGSDGRERRFPPLGAATTVQEGAGDDGERCLGYVVLERGVARLGSVGIERSFDFFLARKLGVQIGLGGLNSADRLRGGAGPASSAERAEVWAALMGWAERAGVGSRKDALGQENGRAGPGAGAGPNLRAKRVARSGLNSRRGGTGRIVSAGLGRASWAESAGLDLHKPKRWVEPVRRRMPEKTKMGGEEGSDG
ncbi:hypothetical protein CDL15_Pgr015052 [Punica granatum]|uniref:Uncharacterized protein n=1 Tax=Punica granatum TaxID=22663 RepID=A0A218WZX7_PUNGR|nr:hypothetical protein CDL15_Pgr015052 [Punica granatum]